MPNARAVVHAPGRLVVGPTDLALAFPHGGTALGLSAEVTFRPGLRGRSVRAEEFGGETIEVVYAGESAVLGALVRGWDADAVNRVWLNSTVGVSGERYVEYPGTTRAGTLGSARSVVLLFSPRDADRTPGVILYRALPLVDQAAALQFAFRRELVVAALFQGIRDATGRVYRAGRLEDLAL